MNEVQDALSSTEFEEEEEEEIEDEDAVDAHLAMLDAVDPV